MTSLTPLSPSLPRDVLLEGAAAYGLYPEPSAFDRLDGYFSLLGEWNGRMNLVSPKELGRFTTYHLLDSLKIAAVVPLNSCRRLMDFGSGGGLPGIPLAIVFEAMEVFLVESIGKKCDFLSEVVRTLGLATVTVLRSRMEDIPASYDGTFDIVATRATVDLVRFHRLAARFVGPSGSLVAVKGNAIESEMTALVKKKDAGLFNIFSHRPPEVPGVRSGAVVVMTRR